MEAEAPPLTRAFPLPLPRPEAAPELPLPPSWTASLLADDAAFTPRREASRLGTGLGLASLYGVALGARSGGRSLFLHAAFVPSALLAVLALGVPALYIALALFDAPIEPARVVTAASRAAARTGLVLAGLAPAAALFVVSSDFTGSAAAAAAVGLFVAGAIGLARFLGELRRSIEHAPAGTRATSDLAFAGFAVFAIALAARVWWATLPLLGGRS